MRALLIAVESLGVGCLSDHPCPNTLAQLLHDVPELELPNLYALGLGEILKGRVFDPPARKCIASYGRMIQRFAGADALSGLWELAGAPLPVPFGDPRALPPDAVATLSRECRTEFLYSPDEAVPEELFAQQHETGHPILSPGPASTLRVWADPAAFSATQLSYLCRAVRRVANWWHIARVEGLHSSEPQSPALVLPAVPPQTLLNAVADRGLAVEAVGPINDAFARSGITRAFPAATTAECLKTVARLWRIPQNGLLFAQLTPFAAPTPPERAAELEEIDGWIQGFLEEVDTDSLLILVGTNRPDALTPTAPREEVPVLLRYGGRTLPLGVRETFRDVAATLAAFFGIPEAASTGSTGTPLITFQRPKGFGGPWGS
ncbi:MAG: hypothetical protein ACFUZC_14125 [Chthoniobacteraceae bacterium]